MIDCLSDYHYKDHQLFLRISGIFHCLCASVYGRHLKPTQEVIDYVGKRIRSHYDTVVCLAEMEQGYYDTSFHIYDAAAKRWLPMGAELPTT